MIKYRDSDILTIYIDYIGSGGVYQIQFKDTGRLRLRDRMNEYYDCGKKGIRTWKDFLNSELEESHYYESTCPFRYDDFKKLIKEGIIKRVGGDYTTWFISE